MIEIASEIGTETETEIETVIGIGIVTGTESVTGIGVATENETGIETETETEIGRGGSLTKVRMLATRIHRVQTRYNISGINVKLFNMIRKFRY